MNPLSFDEFLVCLERNRAKLVVQTRIGRSGSLLLTSFFDNHPEVLMFPGTTDFFAQIYPRIGGSPGSWQAEIRGMLEAWVTGPGITWRKGSGEQTLLPDASADWVLMGSSFHWVDLKKGLQEFHRILRPGGAFTAIWNPRDLERSELQARIDRKFKEMNPSLTRVSSGGKGHAADWFTQLASTPWFKEVLFLETKFDVTMTKERYMGIWNSVNDVRAQSTPEVWAKVTKMIEKEIAGETEIIVPYATRAWTVWRQE